MDLIRDLQVPSIKIFNNAIGNFVGLPATTAGITSYTGNFFFFRGDRSQNMMLGNNAPVTKITLRVKADNMDVDNMIAVIKDNYNNTINNMPLNTNGSTLVNFAESSNPASYALNRFSIVFSPSVVLPVTFNNIKAGRVQQDIAVDWSVSNEVNIKSYDIEKSGDGMIFQKMGTKSVSGSGSSFIEYRYIDSLPLDGNNFYRVKSVNFNGGTTYSNVAKVVGKIIKTTPTVNIYPNPVTGNTVSLRMNYVAEGDYKVQVYAINGQLMQTINLYHDGTSSLQKLSLRPDFPSGKYEVKISGDGFIGTILLLKQ